MEQATTETRDGTRDRGRADDQQLVDLVGDPRFRRYCKEQVESPAFNVFDVLRPAEGEDT